MATVIGKQTSSLSGCQVQYPGGRDPFLEMAASRCEYECGKYKLALFVVS